ncbi:MAG: SpoIID/LytB domain-containing protein [Bacteroidales bacterium]|nr:SpoIID/LytB domain-containing protein [Bacteroidales bacterium]MCI2122022.1 SpoIID/LytB domain-containing protein [Bacteroidales bacterium]MCI2146223.1 SpoIID/LytB domain-containing protein [Bacteroidales bacterium]
MAQPVISVGIVSGKKLVFSFKGTDYEAVFENGRIRFGESLLDFLFFSPEQTGGSFILKDVVIGVNFHWERKEDQRFKGALKIIVEEEKLTAINFINVEDYLVSVISSEMSPTASLEFLKAHAVISRSWVLSQLDKTKPEPVRPLDSPDSDERIVWWDHDDHVNFDVCADDHCQRYEGLMKVTSETARKAVEETSGEVLVYGGSVCDARFSKCCGGALEEFKYCWGDVDYPYLSKGLDRASGEGDFCSAGVDLREEENAVKWIDSKPESFCKTSNRKILGQVLNDYDQETADFYRWKVEYSQKELAALIREKSGVDYGDIIDLIPLARGTSGRIWKLRIVGSKATKVIGKELEIRRTLSKSHLYSSAFYVEKIRGGSDVPAGFVLHGAGWGHGVGLCQIGAAVMGAEGYAYDHILKHYYRGAEIEKRY